jgi:hypothetical protein
MLDSENQQVAFRSVSTYLDRALGKTSLPADSGRHVIARAVAVEVAIAIAKAKLSKERDTLIPNARAKAAELIERRARELADGAEDTGRLLPTDLS